MTFTSIESVSSLPIVRVLASLAEHARVRVRQVVTRACKLAEPGTGRERKVRKPGGTLQRGARTRHQERSTVGPVAGLLVKVIRLRLVLVGAARLWSGAACLSPSWCGACPATVG